MDDPKRLPLVHGIALWANHNAKQAASSVSNPTMSMVRNRLPSVRSLARCSSTSRESAPPGSLKPGRTKFYTNALEGLARLSGQVAGPVLWNLRFSRQPRRYTNLAGLAVSCRACRFCVPWPRLWSTCYTCGNAQIREGIRRSLIS